jgi:nucleotide-binding universal stress UspA family protein
MALGGPMTFERILLPTDGSDVSDPATERAIDLAAASDAELVVCSVVERYALPIGEHREGLTQTLETEAQEFVGRVVDQARATGIETVQGIVPTGKPHEAILQTAAERGCDLIVMGTHGRAAHQPYILGSVTARVLQGTDIEVLVVPTHHDSRDTST